MKLLFLLIIPICVFSLPLFSAANSVLHTDKDPFFKDSADLVAHSPEVAEMTLVHHQDLNKKILIALVVSSSFLGGVLLLLSCFVIYRFKRLKKCKAKTDQSSVVKKIYAGRQEAEREFENEVQLLSKIQHQCIVSLLGYCIHDEARFLVYEMMENGSLEFHLHGPSHGSALTWHQRIKIGLDVARGLEYLHEHCNPPVIHRDLKSSNILLDSNFNAKMSDFGLAITGGNSKKTNIKLSGTLGYVAPECLLDGKLTDKSDVYAFGVVLLELLMGRRPVEKATPQLTDRSKLPNIIDPAIWNTMDLKHLYQVAAIAVLCIQPEPSYRPLITDVLHSFIPLVPVELGGSLRVTDSALQACS